MQRLLQVDDYLAFVAKNQRNHAPRALIVDVGSAFVIDAITTRLNSFEQNLRAVHEFRVGHYNFTMLRFTQILVSVMIVGPSVLILGACGQQGALYLPTDRAAAGRATLPETLLPSAAHKSSNAKPPAPAASSVSAVSQ